MRSLVMMQNTAVPWNKNTFVFPTACHKTHRGKWRGRTSSGNEIKKMAGPRLISPPAFSAAHTPERGRRSRPHPSPDPDDTRSLWLSSSQRTPRRCHTSGTLSRGWKPNCGTKSRICMLTRSRKIKRSKTDKETDNKRRQITGCKNYRWRLVVQVNSFVLFYSDWNICHPINTRK